MDKVKQFVALTVVGALAILAAGWFLLVSPKRTEATDLRGQAASQQTANSGLQTQLAQLKAQAKDLPKKQAELAAVAAKIPDNPALPALVRALTRAADDSGVELVSLAPGTPQATTQAAATSVTPKAKSGTSGAKPVAPTGAAVAAPAANAGALQSISVQMNVVGGFFQVEQFFDRVEALSRAMKVTTFTMAPGTNPVKPGANGGAAPAVLDGRTLTATITGVVYMASGRTAVTPTVPVK